MINPHFFIVGCSRSGTTLLQHMVSSHRKLAVIPETRWFARWYENRCGVTADGFATRELVSKLLERHRLFRDLDLGIKPDELFAMTEPERRMPYAEFVSTLFERYGKARRKPLVGNKTPGYVRRIHTLHTLWPQAKIVHIIRDGRDVCLSALNWKRLLNDEPVLARRFATWREDPVTTAALWWERNVRMGREAGRRLPANLYREIRYEALVSDREAGCAKLCEFLEVANDKSMLNHHQGELKDNERTAAKHPKLRLPSAPGMRNWRSEMPAADVERFEAAAGGLLEELGYPRVSLRPKAGAAEHVERVRNAIFPAQSVAASAHGWG